MHLPYECGVGARKGFAGYKIRRHIATHDWYPLRPSHGPRPLTWPDPTTFKAYDVILCPFFGPDSETDIGLHHILIVFMPNIHIQWHLY